MEKARLEAASARYEEWSAKTAGIRETAGKAKAEQQRRGHQPAPADELQARADDATARVQAQRAELDASSKHTARMERNTKAEPQANWQAEAPERSRWSCRRSGRARVAGVERLRRPGCDLPGPLFTQSPSEAG